MSQTPTPEQIRETCEQIRAEWTSDEEQRRLRPDWRRQAVQTRRFSAATSESIAADSQ